MASVSKGSLSSYVEKMLETFRCLGDRSTKDCRICGSLVCGYEVSCLILCNITPSSFVKDGVPYLAHSSTLKMEATCSSETSAFFGQHGLISHKIEVT
jgi:hypothetical protein